MIQGLDEVNVHFFDCLTMKSSFYLVILVHICDHSVGKFLLTTGLRPELSRER